MPPHLHPRSRATGTLFTSCLAVSFLVVGIPHLLPCPVNPRQFADSMEDPERQQRRRRKRKQKVEDAASSFDEDEGVTGINEEGRRRECPVPKPGGLVGQIMGFKEKESEGPRQVVVQSLRSRKERSLNERKDSP